MTEKAKATLAELKAEVLAAGYTEEAATEIAQARFEGKNGESGKYTAPVPQSAIDADLAAEEAARQDASATSAPAQVEDVAVAAPAEATEAAQVENVEAAAPAQTTAPTVTAPANPARVVISASNGTKHVKMIIDDTAVLAEIGAGMIGQPEIAAGIAALVRLADAALQGAADADVIEINDETIVALLGNVKLDPPTS